MSAAGGGVVMRLHILGPVEVRVADRPVPIERPRQRATLAYLLLHANRVVSTEAMIEALWGGAAPPSARAQVQADLSALRRALRAAGTTWTVQSRHSGYLVSVAPGQLDHDDFTELVRQARTADGPRAADALRRALALWRGPALADAAAAYVEGIRAHLDEQRLNAYEQLTDVELALGEHFDLVAELPQIVAAHPMRERVRAQLMLALHRCGRSADALAVARDLRAFLADQQGLAPGRAIVELERRILRDDPGLDAAPVKGSPAGPVPAQLPAGIAHFVGRADELAWLDRLAPGERPPAVVISAVSGTAGVGKTVLAVRWAHRAADRFPDGQLFVDLRGFDPTAVPTTPAEAVRGFLDALDVPPPRIPAGLDAQIGLYRSLLAGRRVLVVLDNARDTEQVRPLLPGAPGCMVLVTSRNQLSGLVTVEGAHPLTLGLLSADEGRELLVRRLGAARIIAEPDAADEIVDRCARLPLALAIVCARASMHPTLNLGALATQLRDARGDLDVFADGDLTIDVRAVFSWSYEKLTAEAAALFRLLGLHPGPDIGVAAVASLAGRPPEQVRRSLAELARANLVAEHALDRYSFHDLLRAYAAELARTVDSDAVREAALHRMFDHYLHSAHAADVVLDPLREPIDASPARPGVRPERPDGIAAALGWLTTEHAVGIAVLDRAASTGFDAHVWRLAWTLGNFLERRGYWQDWLGTQTLALAAAQRLGDRTWQARSHRVMARAYARLGHHDEAHARLRSAMNLHRELGDRSGEARTHLNRSVVLSSQGEDRGALVEAQRALDLYGAIDEQFGRALSLNAVGWCQAQLGDHRRGLDHCYQAIEVHRRLNDRVNEADTWDSIGFAHCGLDEYAKAADGYGHALDLFRDLGDRYNEALTLARLGDVGHARGDVEAARERWRRALAIFTELGQPEADEMAAKLAGSAPTRRSPTGVRRGRT